MPSRALTTRQAAEAVARYERGESLATVGHALHCDPQVVRLVLVEGGIRIRGNAEAPPGRLTQEQIDETVAAYRETGTVAAAAARLGVSNGTVYRRLVQAGEPRHPASVAKAHRKGAG